MLVRLVGLVMCSVSIIGVHGEGECVYIGDIDILKGELERGVWAGCVRFDRY